MRILLCGSKCLPASAQFSFLRWIIQKCRVLLADGGPCGTRTRISWLRAKVPYRLDEGVMVAAQKGVEPLYYG